MISRGNEQIVNEFKEIVIKTTDDYEKEIKILRVSKNFWLWVAVLSLISHLFW